MRILVSGASGLIGKAVTAMLARRGDRVIRVVRRPPVGPDEIPWDLKRGSFDTKGAEGTDAVVHLAGESVGSGRWTPERKAEIRSSRVDGTRLLAEGLSRLEAPPRVLVAASAVGFYGAGGDREKTEKSPPGRGFLSEVCQAWEAAAEPAAARGIRVVQLRLGLVLSATGGALAQMLTPFRLGLGGRLGDGRQWTPWATIDDVVRIVEAGLDDHRLSGPVNAVSPEPVTNADFTRALARVLRRPALLPVPSFVLRLAFGEMVDELLLSGSRVVPEVLEETGFRFAYPELEGALRHLLEV